MCVLLITIYLLRFIHVMNMRKLLLQSRKISYIFTAVTNSKVQYGKNTITTNGIKVELPLESHIQAGERLEVIGTWPRTMQSLYSERITMIGRTIKPISKKRDYGYFSFYKLINFLEKMPQVVRVRISDYLENSQAVLLGGMVFGGAGELPRTLLEDMKNTGLVHIASASGFNVSVIVAFSLSLFTRIVNRRIAGVLCLISVITYSMMAGLTPPVTRAAVMGVLYLFSLFWGRVYNVKRSLFLVVMLMLIYQPFLIFSISFLLTVSATLGVIFSREIFPVKPRRGGVLSQIVALLEENLSITLSVLLFTTPITLRFFESFSLVAPLANALLLWMIAPLTLVGMGFIVLVSLFSGLSALLALPLSIVLEVFLRLVHLLANLPLSNLEISKPSWPGIFIWYIGLVLYLAVRSQKRAASANSVVE